MSPLKNERQFFDDQYSRSPKTACILDFDKQEGWLPTFLNVQYQSQITNMTQEH